MSDTVQLAIISGIFSIITLIVTHLINRSTRRHMDTVKDQVVVVEKKLDENHKQQNGNLTKLLETTRDLATAKEKEKHAENPTKP